MFFREKLWLEFDWPAYGAQGMSRIGDARYQKNPRLSPSREQGWRSGESARLPPMWPGFDSRTRRHMWVEFVVSSRPCSEGFSSGSPVFLPLQKLTFLNSN